MRLRSWAYFAKITKLCESEVRAKKVGQEREVDGKSIMDLIALVCGPNSEIEVTMSGDKAEYLLDRLEELFKVNFGIYEDLPPRR